MEDTLALEESRSPMAEPSLKEIKEEEIEVLFEYKGSRKSLSITRGNVCSRVQLLLRAFGESGAVVSVSSSSCGASLFESMFLLQKWSTKWSDFVDVVLTR